ncbi:hypothetical protein ZWY2020_010019 [Hordeum vulgare]|nr:hypothetical protein ZWY2020_010019 [Hordeum vulgare]
MASVILDVGGGDIVGGDGDNDGVGSFHEVDNWLGSSSYTTQEGWQQLEAPLVQSSPAPGCSMGCRPDSDSDDEVEELVVLSDKVEEETIVQVLAPIIDVVEGDKNRPIDMEKLPEVADLPQVIVVKQEMEEDVGAPGKKKWDAEKKNVVWRSECLKMLKKEE